MARTFRTGVRRSIGQRWGFVADSFGLGTQPSASVMGTSVTLAQNAMGAYASVLAGAAVTEDCYALEINFHANATAGQARDTLCNVSFDGGSTVKIQELLASCAGLPLLGLGITYYFPLYVPAGTTIHVAGSVNNATPGTLRCRIRAFGRPKNPRLVRAGSFVRTFGTSLASSSGTASTPGTAAESAYVQLGGAIADNLWFWQTGIGFNQSTMTNWIILAELAIGDATNKSIAILDQYWHSTTSEDLQNIPTLQGEYTARAGQLVYGRSQGSAVITGMSQAAYGVGGG